MVSTKKMINPLDLLFLGQSLTHNSELETTSLWLSGQLSHLRLPSVCSGLQLEGGSEGRGPSGILTSDEVVHKGGGHAENAHQQIADGQVENEHVGDSAHVPVPKHSEADQGVTHHAEEENEGVGHDEHGGHWRGVLVVGGEDGAGGQGSLSLAPILTQGPAAIGRLGGLV